MAENTERTWRNQVIYSIFVRNHTTEGTFEGVRRDLAASSAYYQAHHTSFGEFSTKVNDTYLKVNSQPQGVASYGRMVDLLLADYRARRG